mgnify:CR=1 FL=1
MSRLRILMRGVAALTAATLLACTGTDKYVAFSGYAQGGTYTVKANLKGVRTAPGVIAAQIDTLLVSIDRSISGYNKGSLLSRLNAGERVVPDEILLDIYERSYDFYLRSQGALDVSGGPLYDIWGFGFTGQETPSEDAVRDALACSGMGRLKQDIRSALRPDGSLAWEDLLVDSADTGRVTLNFNAIAQGYSCDLVAGYLKNAGVEDMLVDIGEIYCCGRNPSRVPWGIGIDTPEDGNQTPGADMQGLWHSDPEGPGQGVVTSGNYRKFYILDGHKYAHTIDPRTGRPVQHNLLSATVVAPDATTADAVATWCMVLGLDDALRMLTDEHLEACLIYDSDEGMKIASTPGFEIESF